MTIRAGAATEVYDLQNDPREEHDDVARCAADGCGRDGRAHRRDPRARTASPAGAISADAQERLRCARLRRGLRRSVVGRRRRESRDDDRAWNDFEDALSALNAHRPDASAR